MFLTRRKTSLNRDHNSALMRPTPFRFFGQYLRSFWGFHIGLATLYGAIAMALACASLPVRGAENPPVATPDKTASEMAKPDTGEPILDAVMTRYRLDIVGAPGHLSGLLKKTSQLIALRHKPPATVAALRRRISGDEGRFRAVLESEGYYDAALDTTLSQESKEVVVKIIITPGERFKVQSLSFKLDRDATAAPALFVRKYDKALEAVAGKPARAAAVIDAEEKGLAALRDQGYPFAARGDRETDIDHENHTIAVVLPVTVGPYALFGATRVTGLEKLKNGFMQRSVPWKTGTPFVFSQLNELRKYLVYSGLFASVKVLPDGKKDIADNTLLDVDVDVVEGARRSESIAAKYARDNGFGGTIDWIHRNFLGNAEKLEVTLDGTQVEQTATMALTRPNFLRHNQTLKLSAQVKRSDTGVSGYSGTLYGGLERAFNKDWLIDAGLSLMALT